MDHNEIRHKLSEYIDNSITVEEKTAIDEHLKTCSACSDALRELQKTIEHIKTVEEVEPPAWMTQKIMTKVRSAETEQKSLFWKLFFPLSVKVPIQAVAILFLVVGAFYIYRSIQPGYEPAVKVFEAKKEAPATSKSAERVPQSPGYKALDMKQEYEKPAPPVLADKIAPASAQPAESAAKDENEAALERRAARQATAPSMMEERAAPAPSAGTALHAESKSVAPSQKKESLTRTGGAQDLEKVILEKYADGKPQVIVTYGVIDSHKVKLAEERFNPDGERHGIQKEFYGSGQVKTEAQYGYGKLEWYREFSPDGVKKTGKSDHDWIWLKN